MSVKKYIGSSVWFHNVCIYNTKTSDVFFSVLPTSRYPHCGHFLFAVYQCFYLFVSSYFDQKGWWRLTFPNPEILLNVCPSTCTKGNTPQTNQYPMNNIHFAWWSNSSFQNQDILATNNQQVSDRHLHNMSQRMFTLRPSLILFHCPLSAIGPGENPWRAAALKLHDSSWGVRHVFGFEKSFVGLSKQITYQYWTKLPVHWLQKFHE